MLKQLVDTELEIAALALLAVVFLETLALVKGLNGTMFGASMIAIGGIIGWVFKSYQAKKKK